jgi:hypothetical protein
MLRRGFSNGDVSLPTHGNSNGGYSTSSYGSGSRSFGFGTPKYGKKRGGGYSPMVLIVLFMGLLNVVFTGLWMSSKGRYRSLLEGMRARDVSGVVDKMRWAEQELASVRREVTTERRIAENNFGEKLNKLENDNLRFKKERNELREKHESPEKMEKDFRFKKREPEYLQQIGRMQKAIRKESKRTVLER